MKKTLQGSNLNLIKKRKLMDSITKKLVKDLLKRRKLSLKIQSLKAKHKMPKLDKAREAELIRKNSAKLKPAERKYITTVLRSILAATKI